MELYYRYSKNENCVRQQKDETHSNLIDQRKQGRKGVNCSLNFVENMIQIQSFSCRIRWKVSGGDKKKYITTNIKCI